MSAIWQKFNVQDLQTIVAIAARRPSSEVTEIELEAALILTARTKTVTRDALKVARNYQPSQTL